MAKGSLVLATNQGLLYVLADGRHRRPGRRRRPRATTWCCGFSHIEQWGKGLAAGLSIVLLGIMIDRIARAAAERAGSGQSARERAFRIGAWRPAIFTRLSGVGRR